MLHISPLGCTQQVHSAQLLLTSAQRSHYRDGQTAHQRIRSFCTAELFRRLPSIAFHDQNEQEPDKIKGGC